MYIPVFIVSLNTSPQLGFSRKLVILPPSSVITTPYSSGIGTLFNTRVAFDSLDLWNSTAFSRSMSVKASPLMIINVPSRKSFAFNTLPPVPKGVCSI